MTVERLRGIGTEAGCFLKYLEFLGIGIGIGLGLGVVVIVGGAK